MADHTRAKAMEKLESDILAIRAELSDLQGLKKEVQQLKSDMVTMPQLDTKLSDLHSSVDKTLQQILQTLKSPHPPASIPHSTPPESVDQSAILQTPSTSVRPVSPLNLQAAFAQTSLTEGSQPSNLQRPTVTLPATVEKLMTTMGTNVVSDSTVISTTSATTQAAVPPFRLSVPVSNMQQGCPPVQLHGQPPPPMQNTGNTGFFAPVIAPLYQQPTYNHVTGQYINTTTTSLNPPSVYQTGVNLYDTQRNQIATQLGGPSYYAEAVLKGPRLEIPLFDGDNPIEWLIACEKFFDMSGTPYDQWVNLATGHFQGRASVWLKNICVPWQMVTWQQFCQILADRFTAANVHEAVEMLKNIKQTTSVSDYINQFEECVALVKRDHPFLQENFLMSCFIGGLKPDIKHEVCGQRPNGIMETYWYSKVYEKAAAARVPSPAPTSKYRQYNNFIPATKTPQIQAQLPDRNKTHQEVKPPNLCWYCREPWNRQHKCRIGKTIHILQEVEEDTPANPTKSKFKLNSNTTLPPILLIKTIQQNSAAKFLYMLLKELLDLQLSAS